jgi:hypothetical protein
MQRLFKPISTSEYSGWFPDVGTEEKGGAPLLALFEKWPAGQPAPEWFYAAGGRIFILFRASHPFPFTAPGSPNKSARKLAPPPKLRRQWKTFPRNCGERPLLEKREKWRTHCLFSQYSKKTSRVILSLKGGSPAAPGGPHYGGKYNAARLSLNVAETNCG